MRFPWQTRKEDTRVLRFDPHVKVALPHRRSDADIIADYERAVAANIARREDRKVVPFMLRKQAE